MYTNQWVYFYYPSYTHFLYSSKKCQHVLFFISKEILDQISIALCFIILAPSLNMLLVKQIADRCWSCCYLFSIHNQEVIAAACYWLSQHCTTQKSPRWTTTRCVLQPIFVSISGVTRQTNFGSSRINRLHFQMILGLHRDGHFRIVCYSIIIPE